MPASNKFPEEPPWSVHNVGYGQTNVELAKWQDFGPLLQQFFEKSQPYIWRGQRDAEWNLESSLDRLLQKIDKNGLVNDQRIFWHLQRFKDAALGRRGNNPAEFKDDEWWAVGQHFGLATPLLDWTRSVYIAAYFAFAKQGDSPSSGRRAVFALHQGHLSSKLKAYQAKGQPNLAIHVFRPSSDENTRLIHQTGLFTKAPVGQHIGNWLVKNFDRTTDAKVLYKVTLPDTERETALKDLNKMNINHLTLFPDLYGAAKFSNTHLEIAGYGTFLGKPTGV